VGSTERQTIQLEFDALRNEIDRIAATTEFNGQLLVNGSLASSVSSTNQILIQVGIDATSASRINLNEEVDLQAITSTTLGID
ncbi:MAG: flagellin FliC, partial [Nitrospinaceae bacterium]|nr:flagellin FliC [Nitrospinaceae bacterium]NIR57433.1 flagellin FliC [Nitrospinaceae bacterium]NIS84541.1 flagellin FliC [Nitrospinaceae bacterium]NIT81333.1 flagellin FliC [Nitrospinaceae bacterium]NIU43622.1 flagellin FliC [Nitrospinaceae bacterium]